MGNIPNGLYEFVGQTRRIVSNWSPDRRQRLATEIKVAQRASQPRAAVTQAITKEPELRALAQQLLVPRNAGQFWAFIAALLAVLTLAHGLSQGPTIDEQRQTVINQPTYIEQPQSERMPPARPADKPPPRPSKRRKPKGSGRKKRKR